MAFGLAALHLWLMLDGLLGSGLAPASSGRDSAFAGLAGFHALVTFVLLVMLTMATIWVVARPRDGRGHAVVWNAGLVYYFAATSGIVVLTTLYLVPRAG
jgi:hypothetical protein